MATFGEDPSKEKEKTMQRRGFWYVFALLGACCGLLWTPACGGGTEEGKRENQPAKKEELGKKEQAIINGKMDSAHPAVGSLTAQRQSFCSGTLIAPRVVLTAAHCIDAFDQVGNAPLEYRMDIPTGGVGYTSVYAPIDRQRSQRHPQYDRQRVTNDVAIIILTRSVFEVPPIPFNTTAMDASWVGRQLLFMGYGRLSASDSGPAPRKYSTIMPITGVDPTHPQLGPRPNTISYEGQNTAVCQGDSGGPALYEINGRMHVVAVTSHGTSLNCNGTSFSYRTDPYVAWIQGFLEPNSPCGDANPSCGACGSCDNQKQCVPKTVAASPQSCSVCKVDADCGGSGAVCVTIGTGTRCAQSCDNDGCCPDGSVCTTGSGGNKFCLPVTMTCPPVTCQSDAQCGTGETCVNGKCDVKLPDRKSDLCAACSKNADCADQFCDNPEARGGRCLQACAAGDLCPDGFRCKEINPGFKQCVPNDGICRANCQSDNDCRDGLKCDRGTCRREGGGSNGEPCAADMPCDPSLQCISGTDSARCYQTCGFAEGSAGSPCRPNNTCDAGLQCFANPLGGGNVCIEPCSANSPCQGGGTCFSFANVCICQSDADCGANRKCNPVIQGLGGACTAAIAKDCPQGENCSSNVGQQSICVLPTSGTRQVGQSCDSISRCSPGLLCVPGLNICVEDCSQSNTCSQGGVCRSQPPIPGRFCTCSQPSECGSGKTCRIVQQGIGFCAPDEAQGCKSTGCPDGFTCVDTTCQPNNAPEPTPEPTPELTPEGTAEIATEGTAESTPDGGDVEKGGQADNGNTETTNPPTNSCNCQSHSPSDQAPLAALFLALLALTFRRRRA
jgi:MYXO-CTERM domain-containing protein